jgi:hypothetical protein
MGLDPSYIYIVIRCIMSTALGIDSIGTFLSTHSCEGRRRTIMTNLCDIECFGDPTQPSQGNLCDLFPEVPPHLVRDHVHIDADPPHPHQYSHIRTIDGIEVMLDRGEAGLLARLELYNEEAVIVLEDDDAHQDMCLLASENISTVYPMSTLQLWRALYDCFALPAEFIQTLCAGYEDDIYERRGDMHETKRSRKATRLNQLVAHVVIREEGGTSR